MIAACWPRADARALEEGWKQVDWLRPPLGKVISVEFLDALPSPTPGARGLKSWSGTEGHDSKVRTIWLIPIPGFGQITRHA